MKVTVLLCLFLFLKGHSQTTVNPNTGDAYLFFGPNTSWGQYLKVGGNGRGTTHASVVATNGNLHLDSRDGSYSTYVNHYSQGNTLLNPQGGNVGIGTTNPGSYKLAVKGKIRAEEIKVETGWADYVFKEGYNLPTLEEVEEHIRKKGHLINIPSAKEVEKKGIELGEMNKLLLEKIEELILYTLQQEDKIKLQEIRLKKLEKRLFE